MGRTFLLPLIARRPISSSSLLTPQRCTYAWGPAHTRICLGSCAWTCETAEQNRNVEQTVMHVRLPWIQHPGTPLLFFFLSNLTFFVFFITVFLFFFGVFLVLSTKVILNVVFSLSRFILSSNLVFICPLHSIFLFIIYVLALVMREAGTQRLKFSCKRSCLVKLCCILKWFFKEENDLIVNKVLDSGGVLSLP